MAAQHGQQRALSRRADCAPPAEWASPEGHLLSGLYGDSVQRPSPFQGSGPDARTLGSHQPAGRRWQASSFSPHSPSAPQHYALFGSPWGGSCVVTKQSAPRGTTAALPGLWGGVPTWHPWHPQTCGSFHPWGTPLLRVKAERCSGQNHPLLSLREEGALSCESRRGHQSPHDQLLPSYSRGRVTGSSGSLHPPRPPGGSGSPQCCDSYLNNQHFSSHSGPGPLIALRPLKTKEMRQTLSLPQGNWGSGEIKGRAQDFMEPPCWD